ncbi:TetR/AcrR family transcriptional regulator [Streptomyces sp. TS71-3]|uniref:TetR/AcrR family transcriptional regulator n=1 Tax=Streptomyces sp. TS71-3 TaxID=2733862 RepID=UPI001B24FDA4|nr:TetR/AcrR family transcriptional regulator [Streptomyces sp. TS71-3]GHJ35277.1 DNA-binding protein [Streptomyces sp. TS71-3]
MPGKPGSRAPYRSNIRARQAANTRRAVLEAAAELFTTRGYAATSVDAIAEAARVSRSTVFTAAGGKPWLLKTAYDEAIVGDDRPESLAERPASRAMQSLTDGAGIVAAYAAILAGAVARVSALYHVVRMASDADPDVAALWQDIQRQRRAGAEQIVALLVAAGALPEHLDADRAADVITVYNDPGIYHHLVGTRGWTHEAFQEWLARALARELLD